jgi:hypothetical protein
MHIPACLPVCLSNCLTISLPVCLCVCVRAAVAEKASDPGGALGGAVRASLARYLRHPLRALTQPPLLLVAAVYAATYAAVNAIASLCARLSLDPLWPTLAGALAANMGLGGAKDRYLAAQFGGRGASPGAAKPTPFPPAAWLAFLARDVLTMAAGFLLPERVAALLLARGVALSRAGAQRAARALVPLAAQLAATPLHLLALDMYYRPRPEGQGQGQGQGPLARLLRVLGGGALGPALLSRMLRVLVAYGVAGALNAAAREALSPRAGPPPSGLPADEE